MTEEQKSALRRQVETALMPFAAFADMYSDQEDDEFEVYKDWDVLAPRLKLKHFRAARAARTAIPDLLAEVDAAEPVLAAARAYASARQAFPTAKFDENIERTGWELSEAIRAYDKRETK